MVLDTMFYWFKLILVEVLNDYDSDKPLNEVQFKDLFFDSRAIASV